MILFVNACVRKESRTLRLAKKLLNNFNDEIKEVQLGNIDFPVMDEEFINRREQLKSEGKYDDPIFKYALDFAKADMIVVAAPYYDFSFPAMLKQYLEQINISGLIFSYLETGEIKGLCKAKSLYYVTTAGGPIINDEFGFGYVKAFANVFCGIDEVYQIKAECLDIIGADVEKILKDTDVEVEKLR